jgi:hypothetical protein
MIDIRIAPMKARAEAADSEKMAYAAGVEKTRREFPRLTDRQLGALDGLCSRVRGKHRCAEFRAAVLCRLSGAVGDAAMQAAASAAAVEIGFSFEQVKTQHGASQAWPLSQPNVGLQPLSIFPKNGSPGSEEDEFYELVYDEVAGHYTMRRWPDAPPLALPSLRSRSDTAHP